MAVCVISLFLCGRQWRYARMTYFYMFLYVVVTVGFTYTRSHTLCSFGFINILRLFLNLFSNLTISISWKLWFCRKSIRYEIACRPNLLHPYGCGWRLINCFLLRAQRTTWLQLHECNSQKCKSKYFFFYPTLIVCCVVLTGVAHTSVFIVHTHTFWVVCVCVFVYVRLFRSIWVVIGSCDGVTTMFLAEVVFVFDDNIFVVAYGLFTLDVYAAVGFEFQRNFLDQFYYF